MIEFKDAQIGLGRALVSHPFDNLRIFMQRQETNIGITKAILNIYKFGGLKSFYRGVTPFACGNIILMSIYNKTYNKYKEEKYGGFKGGSLGGFYGSFLSTVIEYYRCLYFTRENIVYNNLYKSYPVTTIRDVIGWGCFYQTYQYTNNEINIQEPVKSIAVGSLSGLALWTSMYPLDTIKTRIQSGIKVNLRGLWNGYSSCL